MKKIAVLISNAGSGTNLQAIIDAVESKKINGKLEVVISDAKDAYGILRAKKHNIKTHIFDPKIETLSSLLIKTYPVDYIALTGWRKIITQETINAFPNKILNIHPGLIPDTMHGNVKNPDGTNGLWNKGKFTNVAIQNFLDSKATYAGSTIHFLSNEFDYGPVLARCFEKIKSNDTVYSLYKRLKIKENKIYVDALVKLCNE